MSKESSVPSLPKPPCFEEILRDLESTTRVDVAFTVQKKIFKNWKSSSEALSNPELTSGEDKISTITVDNKNDYKQVTEFLENYQSLMDNIKQLKACDQEMEKQQLRLREKIAHVKHSWKESSPT
ncbi:uncharacterized protein LOC116613486 [Nematostella vectensis]|uniref:uncharacterized protein LOC116613486 n=1 Tax=Nematostella vectensis TaxID=45351 RepID=UPI0020774592|nr:uncharacterized protein LOC116613486 [Nematostella vectensis]